MATRKRRIPRIPKSTKQLVRGAGRGARRRIKDRATAAAIGEGVELVVEAGDTFGLWRDIGELINVIIFWAVFLPLLTLNIISPAHILQSFWRIIDSIPFVDVPDFEPQSSFNGDIIEDLKNAISDQESGHSYTALNPDSGAMGRWQFMPATAAMYVSFSSTQEFLNSKELQHQAFEGYIKDAMEQAKGLEGCELARAIASVWYSGDADLRNDTRPQTYNGGSYPSIKDYADSVASKTSCEQWGAGGGSDSDYAFPVLGGEVPTNPQWLFGMRADPFSGKQRHHGGLDIQGALGTPLIAYCDGTLEHYIGSDGNGDGFGDSAFLINCDDGSEAWYGHNESVQVEDGDRVKAGDVVGELGTKGRSTGPHLHYEIRKGGMKVDPAPILKGLEAK